MNNIRNGTIKHQLTILKIPTIIFFFIFIYFLWGTALIYWKGGEPGLGVLFPFGAFCILSILVTIDQVSIALIQSRITVNIIHLIISTFLLYFFEPIKKNYGYTLPQNYTGCAILIVDEKNSPKLNSYFLFEDYNNHFDSLAILTTVSLPDSNFAIHHFRLDSEKSTDTNSRKRSSYGPYVKNLTINEKDFIFYAFDINDHGYTTEDRVNRLILEKQSEIKQALETVVNTGYTK